jgi:hypothetical protein
MVQTMANRGNGTPLVNATLLVLAVFLTGCASPPKNAPMDEAFKNMSTDERIEMCNKIYRDARVACREGILIDTRSDNFDCMSARMKLDRHCLIIK